MTNQVTLDNIMIAVRELIFDRFIIPVFAIKQTGVKGDVVNITPNGMSLHVHVGKQVKDIVLDFSIVDTMVKLMNELLDKEVIVAYTAYFRNSHLTKSLMRATDKDLSLDNFTAFHRFFFSDAEITEAIKSYYEQVEEMCNVEVTEELIAKLKPRQDRHMAIWVAYHLVEHRRLLEAASLTLNQTFSDGSEYAGSANPSGGAVTTSVQIGSVFSIQEDPTRGDLYEDFNRVGSDNVLGDRYSFWYRLQCWLRGLLESEFNDYSLRKDSVIQSNLTLTRDLDFRSYYDSYPFTLSPLTRGIVTRIP